MKFLADTANLDDIKYCFERGVNDGITTNPKIMESTGDLSMGFEQACKMLVDKYPNVPVSLETDLRGIDVSKIDEFSDKVRDVLLEQADTLYRMGKNVVIKIPICKGGLEATAELSKRGIKTNVTACMTPYQALEAANAGATYVSLFANRMLDARILELSGYPLETLPTDPNWKNAAKENKDKYFEEAWDYVIRDIAYVASELEGTGSSLIVGSIRSPEDVYRIIKAEPQVITLPTGIVKGLEDIEGIKNKKREKFDFAGVRKGDSLHHPVTEYTLKEFEDAADSYRK